MSTKIHTLVDALGNPLKFFLTPGQASDVEGADVLLPEIHANALLADKGYDADKRVIDILKTAGITPVIPPKKNRIGQRSLPIRLLPTPTTYRLRRE